MTLDAEVIVVGGGPAGSATAWALASQGISTMIVDRARFPRDKVCSEYLSPQAARILSAMDVLTQIEGAATARLAGMSVRSPAGYVMRGNFAAAHGFRGFSDTGIAIRRTILDEILLRRAQAAGAEVREEAKVSDVEIGSDGRAEGVTVSSADGAKRTLHARMIVGADGLRSITARRLGLLRVKSWPRRLALVAHYTGVAGVGDVGEMHVERGGYFGLANVGGGVTNVALVVPASRGADVAGDRTAFLEEWIETHSQLTPRFETATRVTAVRATGPFASSARRAWAPGAALVGDAADFFDPFTGEGIYTALRGGELVAPFVADAIRNPSRELAALRAYERARRSEFAGKWKFERLVGRAVSSPAMMDRVAKVLARRTEMADLMVGVAGDFVPPREVLSPRFLLKFLFATAGA